MKLELQLFVDGKPYILDTENLTIDIMRKATEEVIVTIRDETSSGVDFKMKEKETK